jgi:hypothetical protein
MKRLLQKLTGSAGGYHVHINPSAGLVAGIVQIQFQAYKPVTQRFPNGPSISLSRSLETAH